MMLTSCKGRAGAVGFAAFIRFSAGGAISGSILGRDQSKGFSAWFLVQEISGL